MAFFLAMAFAFFLPAGEAKADTDCDGGFCIYTGVGCGAHYIWVANWFGLDNTFSCSASFHNGNGGEAVVYSNLVPGRYSQRLTCSSPAHNIILSVNEDCYVEPGLVQAGIWGAPSSVYINDLNSTNVSMGVGYHDNLDSNMSFTYQIGNTPLVNEAEGHATGWKTFSKSLSSGCPSPSECRFSSTYPACGGDPLCMTKADFTYWCWDFKNGGYVRIGSCNVRCDATYQVLAAVTRAWGFQTASEIRDVLVKCAPPPPPPTLNATLNANPSSGTIPLTSNLSTSVGGTATGPINYSNHSCGGGVVPSDVSGGSFRCQYNSAGTYVAGITVRRQGLTRNATANIAVSPVIVVDGVCGSANGGFFSNAPSSNLCDHGTPSAVTGPVNGPWTWTCIGLGGGATVDCSAQKSAEADNWKEVVP